MGMPTFRSGPGPVFLFFHTPLDPGSPTGSPAPRDLPGFTFEAWRPGLRQLRPAGFPAQPFLAWGLFHHLRLFASRDYRILALRAGGALVHRTCLLPAHFRFPFMRPGDLQAAAIWTRPDCRGLGLGQLMLERALELSRRPGRLMWYMVREDNPASIRLAEKAGFLLAGRGGKQGLAYRIQQPSRWPASGQPVQAGD
jgi:GNAT superfamily N-acetyltransferase